jgi:Holliday junction DNA helicase RuvA
VAGLASAPASSSTGPRAEAISALVNLGYGQSEAAKAVAAAAKNGAADEVGGLVKAALKELAR